MHQNLQPKIELFEQSVTKLYAFDLLDVSYNLFTFFIFLNSYNLFYYSCFFYQIK